MKPYDKDPMRDYTSPRKVPVALIAGLVVTGVGAGLFIPSVTTAGVTALDPSRASLAGGLIYMFQIAGGALGLGITTAIFTITSENELAQQATAAGANLTEIGGMELVAMFSAEVVA